MYPEYMTLCGYGYKWKVLMEKDTMFCNHHSIPITVKSFPKEKRYEILATINDPETERIFTKYRNESSVKTRSQDYAEACYHEETGEFNWDLYAQLCEMPYCDD